MTADEIREAFDGIIDGKLAEWGIEAFNVVDTDDGYGIEVLASTHNIARDISIRLMLAETGLPFVIVSAGRSEYWEVWHA